MHRQTSRTKPGGLGGDVPGAEAEGGLSDERGGKRLGRLREPASQLDPEVLRADPTVDRLGESTWKLVETRDGFFSFEVQLNLPPEPVMCK